MKISNYVSSAKGGLRKLCAFAIMMLCVQTIFAQGGGGAGIQAAATEIKSYMGAMTTLTYAIGAIVGVIGAIRIYVKWTSGDDINKELMGWGGAFIFLMVVPTVVNGFFG